MQANKSASSREQSVADTTCEALFQAIEQELARAVHDKHHEWRTLQLATIALADDTDGFPNLRSVVLRGYDREQREILLFTDGRSSKVQELRQNPRAMIHAWSKRLRWQIRFKVVCAIETTGLAVDAAWQRVSQSPAKADYTSLLAPGKTLFSEPSDAAAAHHFTIIRARLTQLDWLALSFADTGEHKAARFLVSASKVSGEWVQP